MSEKKHQSVKCHYDHCWVKLIWNLSEQPFVFFLFSAKLLYTPEMLVDGFTGFVHSFTHDMFV